MDTLSQFRRYNWLVLVLPVNYISCSLDQVNFYMMMRIDLGVTFNYSSQVLDPARLKDGPEDTLCYIRRYNWLVLVVPFN